jgi:hypothetical protein
MQIFDKRFEPQEHPTLFAKNIGPTSDEDITPPVPRKIFELSRKAKSVDLLKVLHLNALTTRRVEVPCLAKQSGFKKQQAHKRLMWVLHVLQCVG